MKRFSMVFLLALMLPALALAGDVTLGANLSGEQEAPTPVDTPGSGTGTVVIADDLSQIDFTLSVSDLTGITAAHIHVGDVGEPGPIIMTLSPGPFSGTITGTITDVDMGAPIDFEQALIEIMTGGTYINVHTTENPGGEIRGQIFAPTRFVAHLEGEQETPPVSTTAEGLGHVERVGTNLVVNVNLIEPPVDETAAHIHRAEEGVPGPISYSLTTGEQNRKSTVVDLTTSEDGGMTLVQNLSDLLGGEFYFNVHTTANPGGEIRGQIFPILDIFPGSSTLTTDTTFDVDAIVVIPPGETVVSGEMLFNGSDVLAFFLACVDASTPPSMFDLGGIRSGNVFRCPGLTLPEGEHLFEVEAELSNGDKLLNVIQWEVIPTDNE